MTALRQLRLVALLEGAIAFVSSVVPVGTFVFDRSFRHEIASVTD
jgi:hypothetical protein